MVFKLESSVGNLDPLQNVFQVPRGLNRAGRGRAPRANWRRFGDFGDAARTQFKVSRSSFSEQGANVPGAVDLLLGLSDEEATTRRYPPLVYLANWKFSLPLETLTAAVDSKDTAFGVFQKGQQLLLDAVAGASDYCDGIVLERAFAWALSCRARVQLPLR